ncbi:MAG: respiratory nitrate reductase subunit gamma [Gammaproteobacteria bacterium]
MGLFFGILIHLSIVVLVVGTAVRIYTYASTPAPLRIPLTPAPMTTAGVVLRQLKEVLLFRTLFKSSRWTWLFGWLFHVSLGLVILRHIRYAFDTLPQWATMLDPVYPYASIVMIIALMGLWARRLFVDRVRYISAVSDHLMLILLLLIGISGVLMKSVGERDLVAFKHYLVSLFTTSWLPLNVDFWLLLHLSLVLLLMLIFPFSKLLHAPGVFFAPSRYQSDKQGN